MERCWILTLGLGTYRRILPRFVVLCFACANDLLSYYNTTDTGASQLIVDGKIKLKSGSTIESFTERGLRFEDGDELQADVVVFATGYDHLLPR